MQVAQGMAALEAVEPAIVHRDLKPSNVFLDRAGGARVADMNLSLRLNPHSLANQTGETGTYLYMSPEMMRHEVRARARKWRTERLRMKFEIHVHSQFAVAWPMAVAFPLGPEWWHQLAEVHNKDRRLELWSVAGGALQPGAAVRAPLPHPSASRHRRPASLRIRRHA